MSGTPKSTVDSCTKISKHFIDRIKREEEEDQWISGEELCTEGSSDEDDKGKPKDGSARRPKHKGACFKIHSQNRKSETSPAPKPPGISLPSIDRDSDSADEPPTDIWKPKRGSIRLPHHTSDSPHDSVQRQSQITTSTSEALKE